MGFSRRARARLFGAVAVLGLAAVGDAAVVRFLSTAPNYDEERPTAARDGERFFESPVAPSEQISYEILSPPSPTHTVFVLHGMRDSRGSMRPWAEPLVAQGARVVLPDARGHGRSTGDRFSYGVRESEDLVALANALASEHLLVGKVGVLGFSCGGATAIQWAGRDPRVTAVVAAAPFATLHFVRSWLPLPNVALEPLLAQTGRRAGFDWHEAGALPWIEKTKAPILFLHGENDRRVAPHESEVLMAHAPPGSERIVASGATHPSLLRDADGALRTRAAAWLTTRLR